MSEQIGPKIYVILCCRNVENLIKIGLQSVMEQTHTSFECWIYNDASTDQTHALIRDFVGNDNRFRVLSGKTRVWAAMARWTCLYHIKNADPMSIVVLLDGDDRLYNNEVFSTLINRYFNSDYLAGHGNFADAKDNVCQWSSDYPEEIKLKGNFRQYPWVATHLRWFRIGLRRYLPHDIIFDGTGLPYKAATDFAFFLPILELAGSDSVFCEKPLYIYNERENEVYAKALRTAQIKSEMQIRNRWPLSTVSKEHFLAL